MPANDIPVYRYNGARSMVMLHEFHLQSFLKTWRNAKAMQVNLPETDDSDYQSFETLLRHILRAARGYMTWMCDQLKLPDPEIRPVPDPEEIENLADEYLVHLFNRWRLPLAEVDEGKFHSPTYLSRWKVAYCMDAMLEHAVMHPIRHEYQLKNLINNHQST